MRLFIALPLPENIESYLSNIITDFKNRCPDRYAVKWVDAKNIHLTVKFLGETGSDLVDSLKEKLTNISQNQKKINCTVNKFGAFPNFRQPKVVWVGMDGEINKLRNLAENIDRGMNELGFELEKRSFKAHLTLGRVKDSRKLSEFTEYMSNYQIENLPICFDRIILFKSTLTPRGPIYEKQQVSLLK